VSSRPDGLLHELDDAALDALADRLAERTPPQLLDAEQAGQLLNVPATWLLAEARADRVPHVRLGRYVRFDGDELEAWWRARVRGPWRSRGAAARTAGTRRTGGDPVANGPGSA
jgi:excisionase family DNA binding protein